MKTPGFRRILELFEAHRVEYVIVGGVAAVLQGAPVRDGPVVARRHSDWRPPAPDDELRRRGMWTPPKSRA
jgi:hypothetical protein